MQNIPITIDLLRGAIELERTDRGLRLHRLPSHARAQCNDPQLHMVEAQPAGARLRFRSTATIIELDAWPTRYTFAGVPARPDGIYDLLIDGKLHAQASVIGGDSLTIDMSNGSTSTVSAAASTLRFADLPPGQKTIELWLPHNETTELVELRANAPVSPIHDDQRRRWLHHGSSISQGSNATNPTGTWPAIAAAQADVELINLGLSGSALLDPFVARTIRDQPADIISLKLGINLVNLDLMRMRAFVPAVHGFIDTIREGHPSTPLLIVSPILCPIHEDTPGPGAFDLAALAQGQRRFRATGDPAERASGKLTLVSIRDALREIVERRSVRDPHLHYLDGRALYGEEDCAVLPLPDELHPDAATHRLMGERFAELAFGRGRPFMGSMAD